MPVISVVTAVVDGSHEFLGDTYQSLIDQKMPSGWSWQWILQEDGNTGRPLSMVPDEPRVSKGTYGFHGGAAMARTVALSRADGVLLRTLDADDMLPPGALAREIDTLTIHPEIAWCVSGAVDFYPDGSQVLGPRDPDPGPLPAGFFADGERDGLLQVIGTTMCTYTALVRALGGWPAVLSEDVALLLAAEAVANGWMLSEPGLLYRRWHGQSSAQKESAARQPDSAQRTVMLGHVDALKAAGWRWHPPVRLSE